MEGPTGPIQTFGIELELICLRPAVLPRSITALNPECDNIIDAVYNALVRCGVPVSDHNSLEISDGLPPFSQWRVEEEVLDLTPEELPLLPAGYIAEPLELASTKFYHAHEDWRAEIYTVLGALNELEGHGVKFITNRSTGFHVHVGYEGHPVPLRTAKNVFQLATAFESVLDELHAAPRIAIPWEKEERHHCYPLSFFATKRRHGNELFERLRYIERVQAYEQIGSAFFISADEMGTDEQCTGHNSAINFDNLFPDEENGRYVETLTGTIEFRQHAGTLDFDSIVAWIELTTGMLRFCADSAKDIDSMERFVDLLFQATDPNPIRRWDILSDLGIEDMPAEVYEYYDDLAKGTLIHHAPAITDLHAPLIPLLAANWDQNAADVSRQAIQATIGNKTAQGVYGYDPYSVPFVIPDMSAESLLSPKMAEARSLSGESLNERDFSFVLEWIFDYMSKRHQDKMNVILGVA